ncbi:uncharacterized protein LOC143934379 isoform X3 [Lithobates pipiens]
MTSQGPITFHDVVASFSEEQWMCLDNSQKEVYRNVMKDIHGTLLARGYTILNPSTAFHIKGRNESFVRVDSHCAEMESSVDGDFPDILMKIKEEPIVGETQISQGDHCVIYNPPSTFLPPKSSNTALIKEEEEGFSIDDYNRAGEEGTSSNSAGVPGIFKQEPDDGKAGEAENEDHENIIPVIVKQEEPEPGRNYHNEETQPAHLSANGGGKHKTEKTGPLSVEAKKRRSGPQVHGDILSLEEREARRLRVLEGNIKPFLQQTSFTFEPIRTASDIKVESADVPGIKKDIQTTDWCKCGHCCQMSTVEESVCCHEISGMDYPLNDDCITLHPDFQKLCLEKDRLDFLYRFLGRVKRRNDIPCYLHKLRRMSYRAFVVWAHGFLDKRDCKPVPACVVKVVQDLLPYPEELNVGYIKIYDYPAAIMALDHI